MTVTALADTAWRLRIHFHTRRRCLCHGMASNRSNRRIRYGHRATCPTGLAFAWHDLGSRLDAETGNKKTRYLQGLLWRTLRRLEMEPKGTLALRVTVQSAMEEIGSTPPNWMANSLGKHGTWYQDAEHQWRVRYAAK